MTTYTIEVVNEHGQPGKYALFTEPPKVEAGATTPCYSNVWISKYCDFPGEISVKKTNTYYAFAGTVPEAPAPGVMISTSAVKEAQLGQGTTPGSTFEMDVVEEVPTLKVVTADASPSSFAINTQAGLPVPNTQYLIGLALQGDDELPSPVGTFLPDTNMHAEIYPVVPFWVAKSDQVVGSIIDYKETSRVSAKVDFTDPQATGKTASRVTHLRDGTWEVKYV